MNLDLWKLSAVSSLAARTIYHSIVSSAGRWVFADTTSNREIRRDFCWSVKNDDGLFLSIHFNSWQPSRWPRTISRVSANAGSLRQTPNNEWVALAGFVRVSAINCTPGWTTRRWTNFSSRKCPELDLKTWCCTSKSWNSALPRIFYQSEYAFVLVIATTYLLVLGCVRMNVLSKRSSYGRRWNSAVR